MGLVDDFLANNTPTIPPTPDQSLEPVDLSNIAPQAKNPKLTAFKGKPLDKDNVLFGDEGDEGLYTKEYLKKLPKQQQGVNTDTETQTTDIQNANLKELRPNGLKPNVYDNSIQQKIKEGGTKTETTERIRERTPYAEFEQTTPAGKVLEQLRLNPPKPTQDSERMRKMAGIQAISEALRNVVDGVYGSQKAVIVPHKTYTNEFLKEAKNADAVQAKALEKWIKSMNDASKNAMEGYLRYLAQEDKTNIKKIVNTTPEVTTTTEVSEGKRVFAPSRGGGSSRAGGGAGGKSPLEITSANSGISYILDDAIANSAFSYITNFSKSGIPLKKFPKEYQQLINDIKTGMIKPTAENMHAFIQYVYDVFPEAGDELARSIGAVKTKDRQSYDAMGKANRANAKMLENKNKQGNNTSKPNSNKNTVVTGYEQYKRKPQQ